MGSPVRTSPSKIAIDVLIQGHLIGRIILIGKLGSIDARGCQQWWSAKNNWTETWKGVPSLIIESIIWDKFVDGLLDADFEIKIRTPWIEDNDLDTFIEREPANVLR